MSGELTVDSVRQVYNDGNHNAFTDLCRFKDRYYLTFRSCPDGHGLHPSSSIVVLSSDDRIIWRKVHQFDRCGLRRDVRDPHFVVLRDALFVYTGTWLVDAEDPKKQELNDHRGYCAWSQDGETWQGPRFAEGTQGHYIWRGATYGDRMYLCGRRKRGLAVLPTLEEVGRLTESALLVSDDGFSFTTAGLFRESYGDETAFLFEEDGSLVALHRGYPGPEPAWVCRSRPPFEEWTRTKLGRNVGGPMLVKWGDRYLVGGRKTVDRSRPTTVLYWLVNDQLVEIAELPSGGDNSYPGFVQLSPDRAMLSYYSSHEGSGTSLAPSAIYMAELRLG